MLQAIPPNVWTKLVHWNVDVHHNAGHSVIVCYGDGPITTEPGVELHIRPHGETVDDLDAIRAALDPDDQAGHDLIDFDRYPEATLNGIPLTREQRIDGAAMRPAWKVLMREMAAGLPDLEQALGVGDETAKCGVCGQDRPLDDPPPTLTEVRVGTTDDGKAMVRPTLSKPIRTDPETGAICWCPTKP